MHATASLPTDASVLIDKFLDDTRTVFRYIRARFPAAFLGTHTIPNINWNRGMLLFHRYENALRRLARESDELFLFDFQLLVSVRAMNAMCMHTVR